MRTILAAGAAAAVLTSVACAQQAPAQKAYGNVGVIVDEGFDDLGAAGRVGFDFTPYLGVEGEAAYFTDEVLDVQARLFTYMAFAKAQTAVSDRLSVFARVGYGGYTVDLDDGDLEDLGVDLDLVDDSDSDDLFAYGVGAELALSGPSSVRADYTRYDLAEGAGDDEGFFSLAYVLRFGGAGR